MSRVGVVCGGSGSSKFVRAISKTWNHSDLGFIANVGDNFWYHGLYVCPDVDILTYALNDELDTERGWGIRSDTLVVKEALARLDPDQSWFSLGDKDLALTIRRTELMKQGKRLSEITKQFCKIFKIEHEVIPATDDSVRTYMNTSSGKLHLQEYWVKLRGEPKVSRVMYVGLKIAKPNKRLSDYLSSKVIICPANPITSISPTIGLKGVQSTLVKAKVVAVSPFIGNKAISGPAGRLMQSMGMEASSFGVAKLYSKFLKVLLVDDKEEPSIVTKIRDLGVECVKTDTMITDDFTGREIAKELQNLL